MKATRILVTGGAGFIGTHLVRRLRDRAEIFVFDNFHPQIHQDGPTAAEGLARMGAKVLLGDVTDAHALADAVALARPDVVFHLAAETGTGQSFDLPHRYVDVNVAGTARLIEALRVHAPEVMRVILSGSRAVYGEGAYTYGDGGPAQPALRTEADMLAGDYLVKDAQGTVVLPAATNSDLPPTPASIYASTKLMQEYLLKQAFWGSHTQVGILRLQNVFGPGQSLSNAYTGVLCHFCDRLRRDQVVGVYEDGNIVRDFVFVEDVTDAMVRLASLQVLPSQIIDIGSGRATTILEAAQTLCRLFGRPLDQVRITGQFRPGDVRCAFADISAAERFLGWTPSHDLEDGLAQLVSWVTDASTAGPASERRWSPRHGERRASAGRE